ncbi:hypothetical protein Y1Q_0007641 [Alligator mississippiensis]|uniref:Uncharacterized protein n=1 Tax=Alligator mississippiensis TaxID=8496 RepID=A0A151NC86_ALLMI|nr:hypothetical protein Y1Q_0007641 [Alligator mississippiensis]
MSWTLGCSGTTTIECQFYQATSTDWWKGIILGTWAYDLSSRPSTCAKPPSLTLSPSHIMQQELSMQPPLTPQKWVAIAVKKLVVPSSLCYVAIWEVAICLVIQNIPANRFICLINPQEVVTGICCMDFLNCMGAMDGICIPIFCPP